MTPFFNWDQGKNDKNQNPPKIPQNPNITTEKTFSATDLITALIFHSHFQPDEH